ncbi:MAG: hypothetical protein ACRD3R_16960 [Terriglobales bacterium]
MLRFVASPIKQHRITRDGGPPMLRRMLAILVFLAAVPAVAQDWPADSVRELIGLAKALPEVREKVIAQGQTPTASTPEEFIANYRADFPKWDALIKASGAGAD